MPPTTTPTAPRETTGSGSGAGLVILVVSLFFIWGGITSLNDILIPKLKGLFRLSYAEAMLVQFAFFTAYAVVSLPAGAIVARLGYGRGIVAGLSVAALGCLLFVPAASTGTYAIFLAALFILAAGITLLQVAANPLIAGLGSAKTSHSRLTLAQAFNSLGTTVAPYIGAQLILGQAGPPSPGILGESYLGLAAALAAVALVFWIVRRRLGEADAAAGLSGALGLLARPRLAFGAAAIFVYVGAEVTIGSLMTNYLMLPSSLGYDQQTAGKHLIFYWGGAMVGRFVGAFLLRVVSPGKALAGAAVGAGALCLVSACSHGAVAGWTLLAVGLMNAIMFPTIFSLALEGLGPKTPQGSGLLCMAIVGGAVIPLLGGAVADAASLSMALAVPAVCYAIVAGFGWSARRPAA
ncbi:sugar MFS transporter [Phenylobacterium sp.]|uniref:sugar MFS transporter n=1 Tax=Phenylobacterium sp. TaxID=1871053 RepID=UPI0025F6D503|nr:sugar MFS transporter [Phenylobacterium sp.]